MTDQLISFETAKLVKKKGFKEKVIWSYTEELNNGPNNLYEHVKATNHNSKFESRFNTYSAPTQSLLQKWFREVHKIHIEIREVIGGLWTYNIRNKGIFCNSNFTTYEIALEHGLLRAGELI